MVVSASARRLAVWLALAAGARPQTALVVPSEYADHDAPWMAEVAGLSQAFRQQVLLRAEALAAIRGRAITALTLRRDVQLPLPLRGGVAVLKVTLSERARHPAAAAPAFADNRGPEPTQVFAGEVVVPESPAPARPPVVRWTAPDAIEIAFARPFVYRTGNLCIEIDGRPVPGKQPPAWPIDFVAWSIGGGSTFVGRSCDPRLQAMAVWKGLIPGSDVTLYSTGPTQTAAVCLLGTVLPAPRTLTQRLPMPCAVHVEPLAALGFLYPRVKLEQLTRVEHDVAIPALPCLFSRQFAVQWLQLPNLETGIGLATTHAQTLTLADGVHTFAGASVRSGIAAGDQFPDRGEVVPFQMPVLRLTVR